MGVYRTKQQAYDPRNPGHYAPLLDAVDAAVLGKACPYGEAAKALASLGVAYGLGAKLDVQGYVAEFHNG